MRGMLSAVVLLMCLLPWTHGLKCHQCSTYSNGTKCEDPFDAAIVPATECVDKDDDLCYKRKTVDSEGQHITRACRLKESYILNEDCRRDEGLGGTTEDECYCAGDSCNGGHVTSASTAALTILAASTILLLGGAGCVSS